ncbi:MAG: Nif3-like dinuclear metal center hexameric protein, partial [Bacteroidales bacterium]|nr:Nif3-like dinuclear metal center hexameric protein [Bacteroidales bacterium]
LLSEAVAQKADVFISGDFTYHKFFDADGRILLVDIGHYESENGIKLIFGDILTKKFSNFAVKLSDTNTNPIKYL